MITSAQNAKVKLVRALAGRPRERREAGAFIAEGVRLVEEAHAAGWPFRFVLYSDDLGDRGQQLLARLRESGTDVEQADARLLRSLSDTETPQGILAALEPHELPLATPLDFVLLLDSVRDPGNMGTLLRSANASGVQAVLLPPESVDPFSPKVLRAGMGAHFHLPIRAMSWDGIGALLSGMQVFLADMHGAPCWQADFRAPLALMIGGEAAGAGQQGRALAQRLVSIPMLGKTESLNAAVAGSVLMFEVLRQRSAA
ncbi:MAG: TrmH family RNA methyltransferase [Anaerolineae bacterium]